MKMFARCPTSCGEHLNRSALLSRVLIDADVLSADQCTSLIHLHDAVVAKGCVTSACKQRRDSGKGPSGVPIEKASGVSLVDIVEWAQHVGTAEAAAMGLKGFSASRQLQRQIQQELQAQGSTASLTHEFSHLVCREVAEPALASAVSR